MSNTLHFIDAAAIIQNSVAVKVQDWDGALIYPADLDDGGFEIVDYEQDRVAQFSNLKSKVTRTDFDGGFSLTFTDDEGEKFKLIPLTYAKG
jgi:hypothetical protein